MTYTPKPETGFNAFPAPRAADYSDELTEEHWKALREEVAEYQEDYGTVVSGEPW